MLPLLGYQHIVTLHANHSNRINDHHPPTNSFKRPQSVVVGAKFKHIKVSQNIFGQLYKLAVSQGTHEML